VYESNVFTNHAINISEGGLCLADADSIPVPMNDIVRLFIPLPRRNSEKVALCLLIGKGVWRDKGQMGIQFISPSDGVLAWIREYIARPTAS
jgi:hypothetical protein